MFLLKKRVCCINKINKNSLRSRGPKTLLQPSDCLFFVFVLIAAFKSRQFPFNFTDSKCRQINDGPICVSKIAKWGLMWRVRDSYIYYNIVILSPGTCARFSYAFVTMSQPILLQILIRVHGVPYRYYYCYYFRTTIRATLPPVENKNIIVNTIVPKYYLQSIDHILQI